jgi:hypothetical protein
MSDNLTNNSTPKGNSTLKGNYTLTGKLRVALHISFDMFLGPVRDMGAKRLGVTPVGGV